MSWLKVTAKMTQKSGINSVESGEIYLQMPFLYIYIKQ